MAPIYGADINGSIYDEVYFYYSGFYKVSFHVTVSVTILDGWEAVICCALCDP